VTQPSGTAIQAAQDAQKKWGIPSSVQLAQWALESAWGTKTCGPHNYFGMKALPGQPAVTVATHEFYRGHLVAVQALFRAFDNDNEAFEAHAKLLATGSAYAAARAALPDPFAFADNLGGGTPARPRYATDPHYGDKLGAIIRGSRLTRYDA
jgi:flagellum-specific peptidoglycan hydrolase FlgJ